ncbi:chemotaxis protein CheW [Acidihalobacter prosperus]|uniref:CheW-like domain-containing protein n=1 Tax=Acidihalobacter prosperus TaxID=160660 RepID=A0A1A6C0P9_9GAMM|nr:chemotaxis protein CheW [Acidihalobacter prosperus]OBS08128.1 hypothetical protein Thpro_022378 [Acidihalobacter prosperus]
MAVSGIGSLLVELVSQRRWVIPQAILAEIVPADPLQAIPGPEWLRGWLAWRGQQVAAVEPAVFCGLGGAEEAPVSRYAVIYALEHLPGLSYYALPLAAIPHPMRLSAEDLIADSAATLCELEAYQVALGEHVAAIPDFAALERRLAAQLAGAQATSA